MARPSRVGLRGAQVPRGSAGPGAPGGLRRRHPRARLGRPRRRSATRPRAGRRSRWASSGRTTSVDVHRAAAVHPSLRRPPQAQPGRPRSRQARRRRRRLDRPRHDLAQDREDGARRRRARGAPPHLEPPDAVARYYGIDTPTRRDSSRRATRSTRSPLRRRRSLGYLSLEGMIKAVRADRGRRGRRAASARLVLPWLFLGVPRGRAAGEGAGGSGW